MRFQEHRGMANIICGIDKITQSTWFALNKKTGNFACLTTYRTIRDDIRRNYASRGSLVLEFVKIGDEDIAESHRMSMSTFLERLRCDTHKGLNLVFGNILDPNSGHSGTLKVY